MESLALNELFGGAYVDRNVLVTGHTGFKGSWLCLWLVSIGAHVTGLALDPEASPSHWSLLKLDNVTDLRIDLRNRDSVRQTLRDVKPEIIFHLAAQPLVRRSYLESITTFDINVIGLVNLLEAVRATPSVRVLINATTDKVYLDQGGDSAYREEHPLGGHDPYSTSKACAELVTECYRKSFFGESGPRVATARAGNVIGGGDWSEDRIVPDLVRAACAGNALKIRNPDAVRPWQHVLEPLSGYLQLGQSLLSSKIAEGPWNFGPGTDATLPVHMLVSEWQKHWPGLHTEYQPGPHPHEAKALRLDCSKAARLLDWRGVWNAEETLHRTASWYRAFYEDGCLNSSDDLHDYIAAARTESMGWAT
ncbi:CDP-glucose 4,6-dehydratase [Rhodanobacter sp. K2T2]|uniref:CDP-glucose 4,6-dehydratase n=1 Tax=Rhodanobacter sp. K2T2 TaxID=2723085 RepID=UPI0015C6A42E|nr:CDP-glucose 4,6-dehydratase [Rhodanobacter sp. K2T2]NYE28076.1 CDP-glucose 4,6-dehydratase [Rhodanobacter sp. K2T2]